MACRLQEAELSTWTAFLQRAVEATYNTEVVIDNLHNLVGESAAHFVSAQLAPPVCIAPRSRSAHAEKTLSCLLRMSLC
ncbi:jg14639 [Pararge aegeria aegeria]|uniref:Jg14639 protein n=1 Tax=Pararge aegeria aegeria TaxID=348720 RepID=A0A8S4RW63_9NEOP|nr:jg14639 [Pararge aegeria aegeria]